MERISSPFKRFIASQKTLSAGATNKRGVWPSLIHIVLTHLGLTLFSGSPPGAIREIEGFVTHICVTREMGAVFTTHIYDTRPR